MVYENCQRGTSDLLAQDEAAELGLILHVDQSCLPPCWQGLLPTESTDQDAMQLLENATFVDPGSIQYFMSEDSDIRVITWEDPLSESHYTQRGGRLMFDKDGVLLFVEVEIRYQLALQDVVDNLGEPVLYTVVPFGPESTCEGVRLLWPQNGFSVELFPQPSKVDIHPATLINRIAYFAIGSDATNYLIARGSSAAYADLYQPWEGFEKLQP